MSALAENREVVEDGKCFMVYRAFLMNVDRRFWKLLGLLCFLFLVVLIYLLATNVVKNPPYWLQRQVLTMFQCILVLIGLFVLIIFTIFIKFQSRYHRFDDDESSSLMKRLAHQEPLFATYELQCLEEDIQRFKLSARDQSDLMTMEMWLREDMALWKRRAKAPSINIISPTRSWSPGTALPVEESSEGAGLSMRLGAPVSPAPRQGEVLQAPSPVHIDDDVLIEMAPFDDAVLNTHRSSSDEIDDDDFEEDHRDDPTMEEYARSSDAFHTAGSDRSAARPSKISSQPLSDASPLQERRELSPSGAAPHAVSPRPSPRRILSKHHSSAATLTPSDHSEDGAAERQVPALPSPPEVPSDGQIPPGPEYGSLKVLLVSHQYLRINDDSHATNFDGKLFAGSILVRIKGAEGAPESPYFEGRSRLFSILVKGKFKQNFGGDELLYGASFMRPINFPAGFSLGVKFAGSIDPGLICDWKTDTPSFLSPLLCSMNELEGANVPEMESAQRRSFFKDLEHRNRFVFFKDTEYTFEIYGNVMNWATYDLSLGLFSINACRFMNQQPITMQASVRGTGETIFGVQFDHKGLYPQK